MKQIYVDRLWNLCDDQDLALAMNALLDAIIGQGEYRYSVLNSYYDHTRGHRPDILKLSTELIELIYCGMSALMTYETLENGRESALEFE